ncbi:MAG: flagellar biosynthesis switch protein [Phycisphaerae bacterium]|nr:flagellar biosynthesis switch protein [Phycisphaerae bacterium]
MLEHRRDQASRLREEIEAGRRRPPNSSSSSAVIGAPRGLVVAIASGKGGVGKTTAAVNIAAVLAASLKVTLVDADLGVANADILCGVEARRRLGRDHDAAQVATPTPYGFDLIAGAVGPGVEQNPDAAGPLVRTLAVLAAKRDVVIVDLGAGVGRFVTGVMAAADRSIIVTTPEPTAQADAYMLFKCLRRRLDASGIGGASLDGRLGVIVNMANGHDEGRMAHRRLRATTERFLRWSPSLLGAIRRDASVSKAVGRRKPLVVASRGRPAAKDLHAIGDRLATMVGSSVEASALGRRAIR